MQALSVLQTEVEYYRSLKFVPGLQTTADLPNHRVTDLYAGSHTLSTVTTPSNVPLIVVRDPSCVSRVIAPRATSST